MGLSSRIIFIKLKKIGLRMRKYYIFIVIVTLLLIPVLVAGFVVGGTPATLQEIALDVTVHTS